MCGCSGSNIGVGGDYGCFRRMRPSPAKTWAKSELCAPMLDSCFVFTTWGLSRASAKRGRRERPFLGEAAFLMIPTRLRKGRRSGTKPNRRAVAWKAGTSTSVAEKEVLICAFLQFCTKGGTLASS